MATTAGTVHWSLGEMLKVIRYEHPLCPRALERVKPTRPEIDISNCRWLFWVLCFWCCQEPVSSVPCIPPGEQPLSSYFAKTGTSLSKPTGTRYAGMEVTTDQTAEGSLLHPGSLHALILNGNKPFRGGSRAEGLEVKSSLGQLAENLVLQKGLEM